MENVSQSYTTKIVRIIPPSPTGDRSMARSSPSLRSHTQLNNLFKVKWNDSTQFIIYDKINDFLFIKCYDRNPYAPHYLIGSSSLPITQLAEEMHGIQGPLIKEFKLSASDNNVNANPVLYLKLDLHYFNN